MTRSASLAQPGKDRNWRARKRRYVGRLAGSIGTVLAAIVLTALPAQAVFSGPQPGPIVPAVEAEITVIGSGAGQFALGGIPPVGSTFDITSYPADVPAGYETERPYASVINTRDSEGNLQEMYCIDLRTPTFGGLGYVSGTWGEANVPNVGYLNRVLNSYYPDQPGLPAEAPSDAVRAAAVQSAIWFFSDGFVLEDTDPLRPYVQAIVDSVLAAGPLTEPPAPDISITPPTAAGPVDGVTGPFTVTAGGGAELTVSAPAGYELFSDPAGTVPVVNPVASGSQIWVRNTAQTTDPVVITARAAVTVETGTAYLYANTNPQVAAAQKLILATNAEIQSQAEATAEFYVAGDLQVNKSIVGEGAGQQGLINLVVDCGASGAFTFEFPAGASGTVTKTITDLPVGTVCTVTEPVAGSTTAVTVTAALPDPVEIAEGPNEITVTNTVDYNAGSLLVRKSINGNGAGLQDDVMLLVQCDDGILDESVVIPAGTPAGEYVQQFDGIPAGTVCRVSEPSTGVNEDVTVETALAGEVTVEPGLVSELGVTNTYATVSVTERLPRTGAEATTGLIAAGSALLAGTLMVWGSSSRRRRL